MHEFTPSILLLHPVSPIPGVVSAAIFAFTYMCTHFIALYSLSYPLSPAPIPLSLAPTLLPGQDLFCPTVLPFCRRTKRKDEKHDI
jgi:hypothetical protein